MKAVIICNNEDVIEKVSSEVSKAGYEIIAYRWLLKALDNFIEISPHLVIISAVDYPRHWKTFIQYAKSGIIKQHIDFILFTGKGFSEEELTKAKILKIKGTFSGVDSAGLDELRLALEKKSEDFSEQDSTYNPQQSYVSQDLTNLIESLKEKEGKAIENEEKKDAEKIAASILAEQKEELSESDINTIAVSKDELSNMKYVDMSARPKDKHKNVSFMFTNPHDGSFITGRVLQYSGSGFDFVPNSSEVLKNFRSGQRFADCTLIVDGDVKHTVVFAGNITDRIHFSLGE